uniref:Uncharacterized protein n=1 Tax=Amphimedon queenslandica TaxID=400682 RepID=A0A1X7VJS0_AMPQE
MTKNVIITIIKIIII